MKAALENPSMMGRLPYAWIPKAKAPDKLTGDLSAECWKKAVVLPMNSSLDGASLEIKTDTLLFCDDQALYLGIRCQETDPEADPATKKDSFEIALEPYENTLSRPYHHLMITPAGTSKAKRYHIYGKYGGVVFGETPWEPKLKTAVGKGDGFWAMEICFPFSEMTLDPKAVAKQTLWRMNIFRASPAPKKKSKKAPASNYAWSPFGSGAFHTPERFGYILPEVFSSPELMARATKACVQTSEDKAWLTPNTPEFSAEIDKAVEKLNSSSAEEREQACNELKNLSKKILPASTLVYEKVHSESVRLEEVENPEGSIAMTKIMKTLDTSPDLPAEEKEKMLNMIKELRNRDPFAPPPPKKITPGMSTARNLEKSLFQAQIQDDPDPLPEAFRTTLVESTTPQHGIEFWYSVPPGWTKDKKMPLVISFHGTHEKARVEAGAWKTLGDKNGFAVACMQTYLKGGESSSEEYTKETEAVLSMVDFMKKQFSIDDRFILSTGFSRGGTPASWIGLTHPEIFRFICTRCASSGFDRKTRQENWQKLDATTRKSVEQAIQNDWIYVINGEKDDTVLRSVKYGLSKPFDTASEWVENLKPPHFKKELVPGMGHNSSRPRVTEWFLSAMEEAKKSETK